MQCHDDHTDRPRPINLRRGMVPAPSLSLLLPPTLPLPSLSLLSPLLISPEACQGRNSGASLCSSISSVFCGCKEPTARAGRARCTDCQHSHHFTQPQAAEPMQQEWQDCNDPLSTMLRKPSMAIPCTSHVDLCMDLVQTTKQSCRALPQCSRAYRDAAVHTAMQPFIPRCSRAELYRDAAVPSYTAMHPCIP